MVDKEQQQQDIKQNESILEHKGIKFIPYIKREELDQITLKVAKQISEKEKNNNPLFLGVLNGAFMWMSDLIRKFDFNDLEIEFCKVSSYEGEKSTGFVKQLIGIKGDIKGRNIIIVEDIVDTGKTICHLLPWLKSFNPASIKIATLFLKRENLEVELDIEYIGFEIENKFILGYGLDFDEWGRNLPDIWIKQD